MNTYQKMHFTFSDLLAGYVTSCDCENNIFTLKSLDGNREFNIKITPTTYAEYVRNLGENYKDATDVMKNLIEPGRLLFAYGIFYPEKEDYMFEAKNIVFAGRDLDSSYFQRQDWWIQQIKELGDFYLKSQFSSGRVDYKNYSTNLFLDGHHDSDNLRQETDTISRLIYGFASAYMLTGEERFLEAAENGTRYLRENMRAIDEDNNVTFWYHAMKLNLKDGNVVGQTPVYASEFGDDYNAIPAYEQIYALAGPAQTFRITGDPEILKDIEMTVNLFDKYFLDPEQGGYYSHIDPVSWSPKDANLNGNRSRKNWNSVGDHTPAYLINAWLATGDERYKKMLKDTADLIAEHFPDDEHSPFVQEKFFENWKHDKSWGWQQDRAVVGHNLKIAWNMIRVYNLFKDNKYAELSRKIARTMPKVGYDTQRGGWYDVLERTLEDGQEFFRFVWHDRKAWWQQEQGILAYLILNGVFKDPEYLKLARESSAFYNSWFLDHDSGGIYFNVLANGMPYLMGTERLKGSHSMSGYHSFELAYLATVYTNLLIIKQPTDFYFKPYPRAFKDGILRVQPDLLPEGSVVIEKVWMNEEEYTNFDRLALTVKLPDTDRAVKVKVRLAPADSYVHFDISMKEENDKIILTLSGDLDVSVVHKFNEYYQSAVQKDLKDLEIELGNLNIMCGEAFRIIAFQSHIMDEQKMIIMRGANEQIKSKAQKYGLGNKIRFE